MRFREGDESDGRAAAPVTETDVDAINTEEVVGGLEKREKKIKMEIDEEKTDSKPKVESPPPASTSQTKVEETEEQKAMRELLGEVGGSTKTEETELDAIYSAQDARNAPIEEADAFKRDVDSRPDQVSLSFEWFSLARLSLTLGVVARLLSKITLEFPLELSDSQC